MESIEHHRRLSITKEYHVLILGIKTDYEFNLEVNQEYHEIYSVSKSSLYYLDPTFLSHMLMNLKTL